MNAMTGCSRGLHSTYMNYESRDHYRGQKAMIRIYDEIVLKNNLQCGSRYNKPTLETLENVNEDHQNS